MDHKVPATHSLYQHAQQTIKNNDTNKLADNTHAKTEATTLSFESSGGKTANVQQIDRNLSNEPKSTSEKMKTIQDFIHIEPTKAEALIKSRRNIPIATLYKGEGDINGGSYGKVWKAKKLTDSKKETVAVKSIQLKKQSDYDIAYREVAILQQMNAFEAYMSPSRDVATNIVMLKDVVLEPATMHLVFEYVQHDLAGIIHSTTVINEDHARHIMKQLLHGIALCHSIHVVHRDLKPANVLVMNDSTIKIADFGLAKQILDRRQIQKLEVVTLWYRAPEVLLGDFLYGSAIDMWSVGCIMAELMTKQYLFRGNNNDDQLEQIMLRCGTPQSVGWDTRHLPKHGLTMNKGYTNTLRRDLASCAWSGKAFDLLEKLLSVNPSKRITAHDALHHEWFAQDGKPMMLPRVTCLNESNCRKQQVQQPVHQLHGPPQYVPRLQQGPLVVPNPQNRDVRVFSQEQHEFIRRQQPVQSHRGPVNQHYAQARHVVPRPAPHHQNVNYRHSRSHQPVQQPQIRTHKRPYETEEEERSRKRHKH